MRSYGQFCPIAKAAEIFCARWTALILRDLACGAARFSELRRGVPLASPSLISARLKELEAEGIVGRRRDESSNTWYYHLTEAGEEFVPILLALGIWGQRWTRRDLPEAEMDLGLILWVMERQANPAALGAGRNAVELRLSDQPEEGRRWWFLNEAGKCTLCMQEPGVEVVLFLRTDLPTLIRIWRGDTGFEAAIAEGLFEAHGSKRAVAALQDWFGAMPLVHVRPVR